MRVDFRFTVACKESGAEYVTGSAIENFITTITSSNDTEITQYTPNATLALDDVLKITPNTVKINGTFAVMAATVIVSGVDSVTMNYYDSDGKPAGSVLVSA